ncbi:putative endoglucanase C [Gautieria morchelliformis]|nr:putative endoglucanase C [Gautieria morchelliformis]
MLMVIAAAITCQMFFILFHTARGAIGQQSLSWKNVRIGGGGGFVPSIVFNPSQKGLAFARTDIGGAYRLNSDDSWTPLLDFANDTTWDYWGCDAIATDPIMPSNLYLAVGMYTNSWDPGNGTILKSTDSGATFTAHPLPFKVGGNMPGRGMGERLAIDPNNNRVLYFGSRSGHGLYKSDDAGVSWARETSFPSVGTYIPDPTDTTGYNSDIVGLTWVTFDPASKTSSGSSRIFVGVANMGSSNVFMSNDAGSTWTAIVGQNNAFIPHKGVISPGERTLYVSYSNGAGPYDGTAGYLQKVASPLHLHITSGTWKDITPALAVSDHSYGFGGLTVDLQKPGTVMAATLNEWYVNANIFRSLDGGITWTTIWAWGSYPNLNRYFSFDTSQAPWIGHPLGTSDVSAKLVGWMIESLSIDPFDSNHWLYGTGLTLMGGRDLLKWDTSHNVTLSVLATGLEETSVQGLIAPPVGGPLLSVVSDDGGYLHTSLDMAPASTFQTPAYGTTTCQFSGGDCSFIVRAGGVSGSTEPQIAVSRDGGKTWSALYAAAIGTYGGKVAVSADSSTILWVPSSPSTSVLISRYASTFTTVAALPPGSSIAADKVNGAILYAGSGNRLYVTKDSGATWTTSAASLNGTAVKIAVNPTKAGELWVSTTSGIFHSTDFGITLTALPSVAEAWGLALGASAANGGPLALYAAATISGKTALWHTDDNGANWYQISDSAHGFGSASSLVLTADPKTYKRVYVGTNGRGIFYSTA